MGSTSKYQGVRSESDFPTGLPPYGVWWEDMDEFTVHKTLVAVKNNMTLRGTNNQQVHPSWGYRNATDGPVKFTTNAKVYELHGEKWHLIYTMNSGDERDTHNLWLTSAPSGPQTVSEDEVESAIASILGNTD